MHLERLKGWSKLELEHAQTIFAKAEAAKYKYARYLEAFHAWLLVAIVTAASIGFTLLMTPIMLLSIPVLTISIMFLLGICMGLLYAHNASQNLLGFVVMALLSYIGVVATANYFGFRVPGMSLAYLIGIMTAYMERRYHGLA